MALVFIDDLTEGMILASDLKTPSGRFVLAAGAEIKADQLPLLKSWGIIEADIEAGSLGDDYAGSQAAVAEFNEGAETYLHGRFALNDLEAEPVATLFRHISHRAAQKLQRGWKPEVITSRPPISSNVAPLSMPQLLKGDVEIVSLPTVYAHIVELINQPNTSAHQLGEVISKDASLTVRLLRLVNSPFYGFSGKVEAVSRAVSLLGFNELSELTLGISVVRQFESIPSEQLDMEKFWRHSIRCGLFAKVLAGYLGEKDVEKYFTGGLLHDIGRLVMLERMPEAYGQAIAVAQEKQLPMHRGEFECLKTDHTIVGKLLTERWRLSPSLSRMIAGHHSPRMSHYTLEACIVHVADVFAHACSDEVLLVNEVPELQLPAWEETGLKTDHIAAAIKEVDREFQAIVKVFLGD